MLIDGRNKKFITLGHTKTRGYDGIKRHVYKIVEILACYKKHV